MIRKNIQALMFTSIFLLFGCSVSHQTLTSQDLEKVALGQSREQVLTELKRPSQAVTTSFGDAKYIGYFYPMQVSETVTTRCKLVENSDEELVEKCKVKVHPVTEPFVFIFKDWFPPHLIYFGFVNEEPMILNYEVKEVLQQMLVQKIIL